MAISAVFTPKSMTAAQYDEIIRRLEQAGAGSPKGRLYHVCYGTGEEMRVTDIFDTPEHFQQFGATLMPILQQVGVDVGQPDVRPVHSTILGR